MKRSRSIRLLLLGGFSAVALAGCGPNRPPPVSPEAVYSNDYYLPGVGYYHAPFRAWYPLPYNHFDPQTRRYYFGGQWSETAHQSITNLSEPTVQAAQAAQAQRTDIVRGGFGRTSSSHWIHS